MAREADTMNNASIRTVAAGGSGRSHEAMSRVYGGVEDGDEGRGVPSPVQATRTRQDAFCRAPFLEECPKYRGHKRDPKVTPETCDTVGERAPGVGNASHPQRPGVTRIRP